MRQPTLVSPALTARIIHAAMVLGVAVFVAIAWYVESSGAIPIAALPDRRVLYIALFAISATAFGAAMYTAARVTPRGSATPADTWWNVNLGRVVMIWALVEAPAIFGTVAYLLTHDFRALLAPFAGLFLFVNYRPSRFAES